MDKPQYLDWKFFCLLILDDFYLYFTLLPIALATPQNLSSQDIVLSKSEVPSFQCLIMANALVLPFPGFLIPSFSCPLVPLLDTHTHTHTHTHKHTQRNDASYYFPSDRKINKKTNMTNILIKVCQSVTKGVFLE